MTKWKRKCPECGKDLSYTRKDSRNYAENRNTNCLSCAMIGKPGYWKGKNRSEEVRGKISESLKGIKCSEEVRGKIKKWKRNCPKCGKELSYTRKDGKIRAEKRNTNCKSCSKKGNKNCLDRKYSEETRKNMRLSRLDYIEKNHGQVMPNSNPKATRIIRAKAKELGITDLRDAETSGGEFQVCGYFVDGRSEEKNIVFEYNEPFHKNQIERNERRKREIIKELGCKFIEIWE